MTGLNIAANKVWVPSNVSDFICRLYNPQGDGFPVTLMGTPWKNALFNLPNLEMCSVMPGSKLSLLLVFCFATAGCGGGGSESSSTSAASPSSGTVEQPTSSTSKPPSGYLLAWSDEFDTPGTQLPESSNWEYDNARNRLGWYNNEKQYYSTARLENAMVSNGLLTITARKETLSSQLDWGGQGYTSARLFTKGKRSWTYGYFDIRARLPCTAGTWPAIWTLGANSDNWPLEGEIDIMEQTGWDKTRTLGTIHTQNGSGANGSSGSASVPDACKAFHNYQVLWTPASISFSIDGHVYRSVYANPHTGITSWPFDNPQYLLLNLAVGGDLGGNIDDVSLPSKFEIDYVRVYQKP